ncbi:MAG TPA: hypothetical protein DCZ72_05590 [Armatimonadetes bacterium]|nr:hypothetical protein [Armatimonadota bacterium]
MARLVELLLACGWYLVPLLAMGAFIVATSLERWATLRREPREALPTVQQLHQAHREGGRPATLAEAESIGGGVAALVRATADAPPTDRRAADEALEAIDRRLEGPLVWLRVLSDLSPLVALAFSLVHLTEVNRLVGTRGLVELNSLYMQAVTLTAVGLALALIGRLAVLLLERRRGAAMSALRRIGEEVSQLLASPAENL